MQDLIDDKNEKINKRDSDFTEMKSDITNIKKILTHMIAQKHNYLPGNMESPKAHDTDTVVTTKNKDPPFEGGNYMKIGGMWTLKNDISSP